MPQTILLTGSSGTVGTALAQELMRLKYNVIPLDIRRCHWDDQLTRRTVIHDLRKPLNRIRPRRTPDMIIHLAANARVHELVVKPNQALDNYTMIHNVLEYARIKGIRRVLFSSSREIYGESAPGRKRAEHLSHVTGIKSPYTASKYAGEALMHAYSQCYDIQPVIVRLSNVYGRYDMSERVIPLFIYYAFRNRHITVFGKEKKLDFTYVDDCVDGLVRIVKRFDNVAGMTFNISRGVGERLYDLAQMIVEQLDSKSTISNIDKRVGEISSYVGDLGLAKKHLGYNPKVRLKDGLAENIEWYREVVKIPRIYAYHRRALARWDWA